jgi:hypothetical protein
MSDEDLSPNEEDEVSREMLIKVPPEVAKVLDRLTSSGVIIEDHQELIRMCLLHGLIKTPRSGFWIEQMRLKAELEDLHRRAGL